MSAGYHLARCISRLPCMPLTLIAGSCGMMPRRRMMAHLANERANGEGLFDAGSFFSFPFFSFLSFLFFSFLFFSSPLLSLLFFSLSPAGRNVDISLKIGTQSAFYGIGRLRPVPLNKSYGGGPG